jgi:hypothetical protein
MTEAEWLACTEPGAMLEFVKGKASDRKLRYFLVACARRVLPSSPDEDMIEALAAAERFADGIETRYRLARIRSSLKTRHAARVSRWSPLYTEHIRSVPAWHVTREQVVRAAREGAACCAWASTRRVMFGGFVGMAYPSDELTAQAGLVRDAFGNPFRPSPPLASSLLAYNGGTVRHLAEAAYDERHLPAGTLDPARLAVLADALEEAGCSDADLLGHLRGPGPHVRGCFAVDAVTGRS